MKTTAAGTTSRPSPSDVRRAILAAATAELTEAGVEQASLRSIARRVGITHQALTYHFADRRAVLTAVAVGGFDQLIRTVLDSVAAVPPGAALGERAIAIGTTYVGFAREQPALFTLMLGSAQVDDANPDLVHGRLQIWQLLLDTVTTESAEGWGGPVHPEHMALMSWSIVHGLAALGGLVPTDIGVADLLRSLNRAIVGAKELETPTH